jgi:glc operon protein GlcG
MTEPQVEPPATSYGTPISFAGAKKAMAAAEAEATKNNWAVAIAVVDSNGNLVMLSRLDNAQLSSSRIAESRARTSVEFRRPSKAREDAVGGRGVVLRVLTFGAGVAEGSVPIIADGKIIGAIGVSGVASRQNAQIAKTGADAVK